MIVFFTNINIALKPPYPEFLVIEAVMLSARYAANYLSHSHLHSFGMFSSQKKYHFEIFQRKENLIVFLQKLKNNDNPNFF